MMKVNIYEHEMVEIMVTIGIICIKHSEKITGKRIKRTRLRIMYNNKKKMQEKHTYNASLLPQGRWRLI
jgi:hypothetical protein